MTRVAMTLLTMAVSSVVACSSAHAQTPSIESLLAEADSSSPRIAEARNAAEAAAARVPQAGALPDPTLGIGFMNVPVLDPSLGAEMMTMTQVQLATRLPWPGKLGLREGVAARRAEGAEWEVERVRDEIRSEVNAAYYELYFVDRALEVTERNRKLLDDFAGLTASQYGVGTGRQPDVLKAQVERTRLTDQGVSLRERRAGAQARLNALLGRPTDTPIAAVNLPEDVRAAALTATTAGPTFASVTLPDASAGEGTDGLLPTVSQLQGLALEHNPMIRAHTRRVAAEERALALAGKATLPDLSVAVAYSNRVGLTDFFSVSVSAPLPIFAGRKQNEGEREQAAVLAEHRARHGTMVDRINGEIASLVAELRRARDQLTLLNDGILPQARTSLSSATASYRVGGVDFLTLLDAQVTLFRQELDYHRLLADFATNLAALERAVGTEVLR